MKTFQQQSSEDRDDKQILVQHSFRAIVVLDETQLSKLDEGCDDDDAQDGQQRQPDAEMRQAGSFVAVVDHDVITDGDHSHSRDEQTDKQSLVRLNIPITLRPNGAYS